MEIIEKPQSVRPRAQEEQKTRILFHSASKRHLPVKEMTL